MRPMLVVMMLSLGLAFGPEGAVAEPSAVGVFTTTLSIPTYPYAGFLTVEHSDRYNMDYPKLKWGEYEGSGPSPVPRDYTALVVENPWLRLTFLPELGGRLYGVLVKATGEQLLYQNPVIKPTHWGPQEQGWWLAVGGIEWCLPVDEHGYEWGVPWDYVTSTTAAGATVTLWDTTVTDRVRAQITVHLPADEAAFQITPRLENPTGTPVSFKFWDNAMLTPGAGNTVGSRLHFVVPIGQATIHSTGDERLPGDGQPMGWPIHGGVDYSRLGNWDEWLGFFARPQAAQDWAGIYAEGIRRGVARIFPHQVAVGVKGFGFGWNQPIPADIWTDDGSYYVELHGGPSPTFWDEITVDAGGALEWTETWLPLRDLPVLSLATEDLAVGLQASGADLDLGVVLAGQGHDVGLRLWRKTDCTPLWRQDGLELSPGEAYAQRLAGLGPEADQAVLGVLGGSSLLFLSDDLDCPAPVSHVDALDTVQTAPTFAVSWTGDDPGGVLVGHDVQVRDGDTGAPWTDWLTCTPDTSALYGGQDGHTYTYRSRACDLFGRGQAWPAGAWQDTFTTVLLQPAPVLITSDKGAQPLRVEPGDRVTFEIQLHNTGNLAASVEISDPLAADLVITAGPWSNHPHAPVVISDTIHWSGTLAAGQTGIVVGFEAEVLDAGPGDVIRNVVWIDDGVHPLLRREVALHGQACVYLPLIVRW